MSDWTAIADAAARAVMGTYGDQGTLARVDGSTVRWGAISHSTEGDEVGLVGTQLRTKDELHLLAADGEASEGDEWTDEAGAVWELTNRLDTLADDLIVYEVMRKL